MTWTLPTEPELDLEEIQAHSAVGFGAAWQALGAFTSNDHLEAAKTIADWAEKGRITPAAAILERKGRPARSFLADQPINSRASGPWVALAVSSRLLRGASAPTSFGDESFDAPSMAAIGGLHDPRPESGAHVGSDWVVGSPERPIDVLVVAAAGSTNGAVDVLEMFQKDGQTWIEASFVEPLLPLQGASEHFGFRDGISQPAVFGTFNGGPFETERRPAEESVPRTTADNELTWPGEFWFGYHATSSVGPKIRGRVRAPNDAATAAFARNGSLLVYRRLAQNVPAFREFTERAVTTLRSQGIAVSTERLRALLVGRERTGAPVATSVDRPDTVNGFTFADDEMSTGCPLSAHIRKVNPRSGTDFETVPRILRRGAPFGPPFDPELADSPDIRGLTFLGYQTSFDRQFRRIMVDWVNSPAAPNAGGGHDPIIGQAAPGETRFFDGPTSGVRWKLDMGHASWVRMTGGGFLFSPSIGALRGLADHG